MGNTDANTNIDELAASTRIGREGARDRGGHGPGDGWGEMGRSWSLRGFLLPPLQFSHDCRPDAICFRIFLESSATISASKGRRMSASKSAVLTHL